MKLLLLVYDLAWFLLIPFLRFSDRLKEGFECRTLKRVEFGKVDLWFHAASAGEAYMARQLILALDSSQNFNILVTTNTSQGRRILERSLDVRGSQITVTYIPFDRPSLLKKAVKIADARLLILLELEIWPGLMTEFLKNGGEIVIVNGRMTKRSFGRYLKVHSLWKKLQPRKILAISEDDRQRLSHLFDQPQTYHVPNIKFDKLEKCNGSLREGGDAKFLVLASIRQEEEDQVLWLIEKLLEKDPGLTLGLFPRHMHRLEFWEKKLSEKNIGWLLKSRMQGDEQEANVILWDVFGELTKAYRRADAAYVGGSLVPLGGQNFIEAFMNGVVPVTGPHITNFLWAGEEVFESGLVKKGGSKEAVLQLLLETLTNPMDNALVEEKANSYIAAKQGGTSQTCGHILELLQSPPG